MSDRSGLASDVQTETRPALDQSGLFTICSVISENPAQASLAMWRLQARRQ